MFNRLSTREKFLFRVLIIIIVLYFCLKFFVIPQVEAYQILYEDTEKIKQQLSSSYEIVESLNSEEKKLNNIHHELSLIEAYFSAAAQEGILLAKLGTQAQEEDVVLSGFYLNEAVDRNYYLEIPLEFSIRGDYLNIINFLEKIEDSGYLANLTEIKSFSIKPWREDEDSSIIEKLVVADVEVLIYMNNTVGDKIDEEDHINPDDYLAGQVLGRYNSFIEVPHPIYQGF